MSSRWRFCGHGGPNDLSRRKTLEKRIDAWWKEFQSKTGELDALFSQQLEWDLPQWMADHLQRINSRLMWEYGPAVHGEGHRLVITPEVAHHLRPLVSTIMERAPRVAGWEFYTYRLPENVELAEATIEARTGGDMGDIQVRVGRGEHQNVELCFCSSNTADGNDEEALGIAFVAAETLLGEECLDKWIGAIRVSPLSTSGTAKSQRPGDESGTTRLIPLHRLKDTVDAVIGSIRDQLPQQPHGQWVDNADWTLWELKPDDVEDYPQQLDLFVAKSANPQVWTAAHNGGLFYSERFSRCGETFCYVKLDGSEGLDEEQFADKAEMEDALDAVLKSNNLGCHMGGGTGLRYSYLDLALSDLERGLDVVRKRLQEVNVPKRSWIQFFDADLAGEWVSIYDDSPAPPMPAL